MQAPVKDTVAVPERTTIKPWLESMKVGETLRFPAGTSVGSLRTSAWTMGIKVSVEKLKTGEVRITRRK